MKLLKLSLLIAMLIHTVGFAYSAKAEMSDAEFEAKLKKYLSTDSGKEFLLTTIQSHAQKRQMEQAKDQEKNAALEMEKQFKNPVNIEVGSSPVKGPADAKVTIVEFSDFECPFCSRGKQTMDEVLKAYPKDVKVAFKNLPLDFHQQAEPAAKAALAAGKQGKFWEYHDALFENQKELNDEFYITLAKKLELNVDKFKSDMGSAEIAKQIEDDKALAKKHGISGTPGFFVNGVAVKGAYPVAHFKKIIDRWLTGGNAGEAKKG